MADLYKYGVAVHLYKPIVKRAVVDFAVSADWTPAAGDVKISKDGGAAANVTNLPTAITMGNTALWDYSITATEMQAAKVRITVSDSATKAVEDTAFEIDTYGNASAQHQVDLADSVRAGLTALPNAAAGANGGLPLGNASARVDVGNWLGAAVTAATAGVPDTNAARINNVAATSVTTINANVGTTQPTNFTGTGASALAKADMVDVAGAAVATGTAQIGANVVTNGDKTGYGLSAAAVQAIWDALTSALTTVGSVGKLLVDNINATISSRLATAGYTAPPSAASVSTQVWTEPIPGAFGAGSAGAKLNSASAAGDPWATAVPGAYGAGTAGNILGNRLDVAVSTRATSAGAGGAGSRQVTITVDKPDTVTPLGSCAVWVSTDAAGTNVVAGTLYTNDSTGQVQFMLDNGSYYYWRQHPAYTFTNPVAITVS